MSTQKPKLSLFIKSINLAAASLLAASCFAQQGSGYVESIWFKNNSAFIQPKYYPALNEIAAGCRSDSFSFIRVFAFADTTGTEDYNDDLSGKRANAVYSYITSRCKLDSTKVYVTWLGESADIYDLHFPEAHAQQRCVDVWISFYKK